MATIAFNNQKSPFFKALKEKVDNYFSENEIRSTGNSRLFMKGLYQVLIAAGLYTILVFFTPNVIISIILCVLFGLDLALIGFNIMHEGGHASFSRHKWINRASAYSLNMMGGNAYFWKLQHNVNHHTYTNIEGMDSDIAAEPFMRFHEEQPRYWFHRFQHLYWIFLYGLTYLSWVFYQDFTKYFTGNLGAISKPINGKEHLIFWASKLSYVFVYIVLPVIMIGWLKTLVGFVIITFVCGLFTTMVFQLAHVVEGTTFPEADCTSNKIEQEWAIHQMNTTANFGTRSKLLFWLLGGLNFQVEHHLFPKISHVHYPKISELVKETCVQFDVKYIEYPSAAKAFQSHMLHIRRLGRKSA